jgi:tight adherence protein B
VVVTSALLIATALVLWPEGGALRRDRLAYLVGRRGAQTRRIRLPARHLPSSAAAGAALGGALFSTPLVAVLAGAGAFLGVRTWLAARSARWSDGRLRSLADGLGALAADLRAGRSLDAATRAAATACADDEAGASLARAVRAPDSGPSRPEDPVLGVALERIAAAVRLSGRTGCSLAAVAAAVEDDLRARHRHRLELRAATAAPRASASLLAGLPLVGLAMGSGVGADPWGVLTGTNAGQVLLVVGVALEAAGLTWSRRLVARALR